MIEGEDYTLNDIHKYEGGFDPINVRCPTCNKAPGQHCNPQPSICRPRLVFFGDVLKHFSELFEHSDIIGDGDLFYFGLYTKASNHGSSIQIRQLYGEYRSNALVRHSLMSLRELHGFMDYCNKTKLKGNS